MIILDDISKEDSKLKIDFYKNLFLSEKVIGIKKYSLGYESVFNFIRNLTDAGEDEVIINSGHQHLGQDRVDPENITAFDDFIYHNIHSDISSVSQPYLTICRLIGMKMDVFECDSSYGKTFFLDREKMLEDTPLHIREWMRHVQILSFAGQPKHDDIDHVAGEDWDGKIWPIRSMPAIITHPVTGVDNFAFTGYRFGIYGNDLSLEKEYREFLTDYLRDQSNWWTWEWSEGKWIIWDNYNLLHTYSSGWKDGQRVFTRFQSGFTWPFYKAKKNE